MGINNSKQLLELAASKKEQEAISLLSNVWAIDLNYSNIDGDSALHLSCSNNLSKLAEKLLSYDDVDINKLNKFKSSPLHIATRMGNIQIIRLLLKYGKNQIKINIETCHSLNALTISASCNNLSITRLLLEYGCHIQDISLIYAAMHENGDEMCRILLNHGCNVNSTDKYGNTALMQACSKCNQKVVNVLISREWRPIIQINKQNQFGWTSLHFAYSNNNKDKEMEKANIIKMLLDKNANNQIKNDDGKIAKDVKPLKPINNDNNNNNQPPKKKRKLNSGEFDTADDDLYNDYVIPKVTKKQNNNKKRGRKKLNQTKNNVPLRRSPRKRRK